MTILKNKERNITKKLSYGEKQLGVDLKLTPDNDLELNNLDDFSLISGIANLAQATKIKLSTEERGNRYHPKIGLDFPIGEKTQNPINLKFSILKSLRQDDRLDNVEVKVQLDGNVYLIDIRITILDTNINIPLKYVPRN